MATKRAPRSSRGTDSHEPAQGGRAAGAEADEQSGDDTEPRDDTDDTHGSDDDDALIAEVVDVDAAGAEDAAARDSTLPAIASSTRAPSTSLAAFDPMAAYMREVRRFSLLTREEEIELATRYIETGDVDAAATLVTSNLRLVVKIAYEYRRAYKHLMDLVQEGNIGLMQAVKKYDPFRGVKFSSYAALWIRAYILRFILNNWRLVKLGTTQVQRKLFYNLNREKARLASLGIEPTAEAVAKGLNVPEKEVTDMEGRLAGREVSLDAPVGGADDMRSPRVELLPAPRADVDELLAREEESSIYRAKIGEFGEKLAGKDRIIFFERLVAEEPRTLQDIGDQFGVSRERVRQLEKRLQDKLRKFLEQEVGAP